MALFLRALEVFAWLLLHRRRARGRRGVGGPRWLPRAASPSTYPTRPPPSWLRLSPGELETFLSLKFLFLFVCLFWNGNVHQIWSRIISLSSELVFSVSVSLFFASCRSLSWTRPRNPDLGTLQPNNSYQVGFLCFPPHVRLPHFFVGRTSSLSPSRVHGCLFRQRLDTPEVNRVVRRMHKAARVSLSVSLPSSRA